MSLQIFGREHLKVNSETQSEIIKRFNNYEDVVKSLQSLMNARTTDEIKYAEMGANDILKKITNPIDAIDPKTLPLHERESIYFEYLRTGNLNGKKESNIFKVQTATGFSMKEMHVLNKVHTLSQRFSNAIKKHIGAKKMKKLGQMTSTPEFQNTTACASHDFLDTNQVMIDVLEEYGIPYGSEAFDSMCSDVWNLAKKNNFYVKLQNK